MGTMTDKHFLQNIHAKAWFPYFLIIVFIFIIYLPTAFYGITRADDNVLVVDSYQFDRNISNIPRAFTEDIYRTPDHGGSFYRPILRLSFMIDAQFGENNVIFVSHFSNILLHIISVCLLFYLLLMFAVTKNVALVLSLIFAIHPLTAHTVSWIPGRNDSLLAINVLGSVIFFLDFLKRQKRKSYIFHLLFFVLALLTKETAIVLPAIYCIYLIIFHNIEQIKNNYKKYLLYICIWGEILFFWFIARYAVLQHFLGNNNYDIFSSIYHNALLLLPILGKIFLPFNLSTVPVLTDMHLIYGLMSLVSLILYFSLSKNKKPKLILFGISWFLLFILPTFTQPITSFYENRLYVPMFGFIFIIIGLGQIESVTKFFKEKIKSKVMQKQLSALLVSLLIFGFASITIYRNTYYTNAVTFWGDAVATSPSDGSNHTNLGIAYYFNGDFTKAEIELRKALDLNNTEPFVYNYLGLLYVNQQNLDLAETAYKKEIELNPYYPDVYFNIGNLYYAKGKTNEADAYWVKSLILEPNNENGLEDHLRKLLFTR